MIEFALSESARVAEMAEYLAVMPAIPYLLSSAGAPFV